MANVTGAIPEINYEKKPVPQEQMQREADYVRAQQILCSMLQNGLISLSEFNCYRQVEISQLWQIGINH